MAVALEAQHVSAEDLWHESGWRVLNLLLLRGQLSAKDRLAAFRTDRLSAELIMHRAQEVQLSLGRPGTPSVYPSNHATLALLELAFHALPPLDADLETQPDALTQLGGPGVHLVLHSGVQVTLPPTLKPHVTTITFANASLTCQQWQQYLADLQLHHLPRLSKLRLNNCSTETADGTTVTSADNDSKAVTCLLPTEAPCPHSQPSAVIPISQTGSETNRASAVSPSMEAMAGTSSGISTAAAPTPRH